MASFQPDITLQICLHKKQIQSQDWWLCLFNFFAYYGKRFD